ncbi:hypothetical protein [Microbacterium sp. JZ31]|uniref:hypothetical protein n=1 Tax=Microbacterium sp. JZ31 TaxID=1906274 RepID=UPI0019313BAF|nr:hypothetical protein [Microbacterium sp. JZ31]
MHRTAARCARAVTALALVAALTTGCGIRIPTDPDGTLDRVENGQLRAGASPDGDRVHVDGDDVGGPLPELVEQFAASVDAEVAWTVASEESLVTAIEEGELDLAVGGMTDRTPWTNRVAITRGFTGLPGVDDKRPVVLLAPLGENRFVSELETFLDQRASAG